MNTSQTRFLPIFKKPKEKPIAIPLATPNQIRTAATKNLQQLKLSRLSPIAIKWMASNLARKYDKNKKRQEYAKEVKSRNWRGNNKGRDIVKSVTLPTQFWAERRIARKWNWDGK